MRLISKKDKKLLFRKETIAHLEDVVLNNIYGGETGSIRTRYPPCDTIQDTGMSTNEPSS
jgi:hypothetical protein